MFLVDLSHRRRWAYAGKYGSPIDGGEGNGKGIYLFEMDAVTGELKAIKLTAETRNPSWVAIDPSGRYRKIQAESSSSKFGWSNHSHLRGIQLRRRSALLRLTLTTESGDVG